MGDHTQHPRRGGCCDGRRTGYWLLATGYWLAMVAV